MVRRFAENTEVPVERSRAEIERLLKAHGASQFGSASDEEKGVAFVMFKLADRMFRIEVRSPDPKNAPKPSKFSPVKNDPTHVAKWMEQEERRRWRAQLLLIKAKLEMIAMGTTTVEREFMADMLMANGMTVAQTALPQLAAMYKDGKMPKDGILMLGSGR